MKKKYFIIGLIILIIICVVILLTRNEKLDFESVEVKELYSYLGEVDLYHCGGLTVYSGNTVTIDSISDSNKLCMAFYNLNSEDLTKETTPSTGKNDNDIKICKIGENVTFTTSEDDEKNCTYNIISKKKLNAAYKDIYGTDISKDNTSSFNISSTNTCYLEGEEYYCGNAETFSVAITPETNVYRLKFKAIKDHKGNIIISDYYLRIANNKCYLTNNSEEESSECTKALSNLKGSFEQESESAKADFVKKYGRLYRHTFQNKDNDYYWVRTEAY